MSDDHVDVISEQFEFTIDKLIQEGYSEVDILKGLSFTLWSFAESFEEIEDEESCG